MRRMWRLHTKLSVKVPALVFCQQTMNSWLVTQDRKGTKVKWKTNRKQTQNVRTHMHVQRHTHTHTHIKQVYLIRRQWRAAASSAHCAVCLPSSPSLSSVDFHLCTCFAGPRKPTTHTQSPKQMRHANSANGNNHNHHHHQHHYQQQEQQQT